MKRGVLVRVLIVQLAMALTSPVAAGAKTSGLVCTATGGTSIARDPQRQGIWNWKFDGAGSCLGGLNGVQTLKLDGGGDSFGLGLCDQPEHFVFDFTVTVEMLNHRTGRTTTYQYFWGSAVGTFPGITPFSADDFAPTSLRGFIATHIGGKCPPAGNPSTLFVWSVVPT